MDLPTVMNAGAKPYIPKCASNSKVNEVVMATKSNSMDMSHGQIMANVQRKRGGKSGKDFKKPKQSKCASHLVNFTYSNSQLASEQRTCRQHKPSLRNNPRKKQGVYKSQSNTNFLCTSYKLIVAADVNPLEEAFYNPDRMVQWDDVRLVVALNQTEATRQLDDCQREEPEEMEQGTPPSLFQQHIVHSQASTCPICLGPAVLPVIIKCGHIFCFTCLLRYLHEEESRKCPMCSDFTRRSHMKELLYESELYPLHTPSVTTKKNATAQEFGVITGQKTLFFLLMCKKCLICPTLPDPSDEHTVTTARSGGVSLPSVVPSYDSPHARFCRINTASSAQLQSILVNRLAQLDHYRELCLQSARSGSVVQSVDAIGDVEYLPFFPEAEEILQDKIRQIREKMQSTPTMSRGQLVAVESSGDRFMLTPAMREESVWMYQHWSGRTSFLHPSCVRCLQQQMLKDSYGSCVTDYTSHAEQYPPDDSAGSSAVPDVNEYTATMLLPRQLCAVVLEIENHTVTAENRRRFPFVRHLPVECPFALVEIDMRSIVDEDVYKRFEDTFADRKAVRMKREKDRKRMDKRDTRNKLLAERQEVEDRKYAVRYRQESEKEALESLLSGPRLGTSGAGEEVDVSDLTTDDAVALAEDDRERQRMLKWGSFARVTEMMGSFPSLAESIGTGGGRSRSNSQTSTSASVLSHSPPKHITVMTSTTASRTPPPTAWATPRMEQSQSTPQVADPAHMVSPSWVAPTATRDPVGYGGALQKRKGKKNQSVSLFSNSSNRSYY